MVKKILTEEYKRKIRLKLNGGNSTSFKKGHIPWIKGKKHTFKTKIKMSRIRKGKKLSEEHKRKLSESGKGRIISPKTKLKMSKARKERYKKYPISEQEKERLRKLGIGRTHIVSEETKRKIGLANSGEKNSRWIKNREILKRNLRNDPEYKQWVKKVKKRDYYTCRINNEDCSGYCIVHHILSWSAYPELRYNINNGITLCQAHHPTKRAEEKRLIPFFTGLVPVSN